MSWKERIELSLSLLEDVCRIAVAASQDSDDLTGTMEAIRDYSSSAEFTGLEDKDKEHDSVCILSDAVQACFPSLLKVKGEIAADPPEYMSITDAKEVLCTEYLEALQQGEADIYCLNVNDWMDQIGVVIVDDGDEHLKGKRSKDADPEDDGSAKPEDPDGTDEGGR